MPAGATLDVTNAAERRSTDVRFRKAVPFAFGVFLCMRVALSLTAVLTVGHVHLLPDATPDGEVSASPGWHNAFDGTDRWDAVWFERIARDGYDTKDAGAAFFPGYPIAI